MADLIYCKKKDGRLATFRPFIWKNMGKRKEGWIQISEKEHADLAKGINKNEEVGEEVKINQTFNTYVKQAKDLEKSEDFEGALQMYEAAKELKTTKALENAISKVKSKLS